MDLAKSQNAANREVPEELSGVIVLSYSPMGTLRGSSGQVQVEARETILSDQQVVSQCIRLELATDDDYPQTEFATISYRNIDKLLSALERLKNTNINQDRFTFSEVQCEIEEIKLIIFNNERGSIFWAITSGSVSIHFNMLSRMSELTTLIIRAKKHLDDTKI